MDTNASRQDINWEFFSREDYPLTWEFLAKVEREEEWVPVEVEESGVWVNFALAGLGVHPDPMGSFEAGLGWPAPSPAAAGMVQAVAGLIRFELACREELVGPLKDAFMDYVTELWAATNPDA